MPWILASASPRRAELLRGAGQRFAIVPSRVDESRRPGEDAFAYAGRVAGEKAREVASRKGGRWVLGADTVVILDGEPLGKPEDRAQARSMLQSLSGRAHVVATAVVLVDPAGRIFARRIVHSDVVFRPLKATEIDFYVASGEPLDKAGAYGIQGGARGFVAEVRGSTTNVVGLPMDETAEILRAAGLWIAPSPAW